MYIEYGGIKNIQYDITITHKDMKFIHGIFVTRNTNHFIIISNETLLQFFLNEKLLKNPSFFSSTPLKKF